MEGRSKKKGSPINISYVSNFPSGSGGIGSRLSFDHPDYQIFGKAMTPLAHPAADFARRVTIHLKGLPVRSAFTSEP
jgi:hypothetical protein